MSNKKRNNSGKHYPQQKKNTQFGKAVSLESLHDQVLEMMTPEEKQRNNVLDVERSTRHKSLDEAETSIKAPYNFVPFFDAVYSIDKSEITPQNSISNDRYTGAIEYKVTAKTDIIVGGIDGEHFYKNSRGKYAIPGSTMRGLVRGNAQILGMVDFRDDIDNNSLMFRDIAGGANSGEYNNILGTKQVAMKDGGTMSVVTNVMAGYITCRNKNYYICKCSETGKPDFGVDASKYGSMNYFAVNEERILKDRQINGKHFDCFFENGKTYLQNITIDNDIEKGLETNKSYCPYYFEISYDKNGRSIEAIGMPGKYKYKGCVISSGFMNKKKTLYVVPEQDVESRPITIPEQSVKDYLRDYNGKINQLEDDTQLKKKGTIRFGKQMAPRNFFSLPNEGETKPVFYIFRGMKVYFGFTPRLRIFYNYDIHHGIRQDLEEGKVDLSKAMFGFIEAGEESESLKSRVSFSDVLAVNSNETTKSAKLVLAAPKATYYNAYLADNEDSGSPITYNSDSFRLRGVKQYWLHDSIEEGILKDNEKVASYLYPLSAGTEFKGNIRYNNLTGYELGLLLWSLCLDKNSEMNVGKGKAYGYGRIKVTFTSMKNENYSKAYNTEKFSADPFDTEDSPEKFINEYKEYMKKNFGVSPEDLHHVREFFIIHDSTKVPNKKFTQYMNIDDGDYRGDNKLRKILPSITGVMKADKKK